MDETSSSAPTLPCGIKWRCDQCHAVLTTVPDAAAFMVPHCRRCREKGKSRYMTDGILMYEGDRHAEIAKEIPRNRPGVDKALWQQFCTMLDVAQARMADGRPSTTYCRACEETAHTSTVACPCPCHAAWEFRRAVEAQQEKAA